MLLIFFLIFGGILISLLPSRISNFNIIILLYSLLLLFIICGYIIFVIWNEYFLNIIYYNIFYIFIFDSLSLLLIFLTNILYIVSILVIWNIKEYKKVLHGLIYLVIFFTIMSFSTFNLFFFYIFFELILIPMFLIIGIWGSRERKLSAAFRFFIYTLFGSVFFLIVIIYLVYCFNTLNLFEIYIFVRFDDFTQYFFWFLLFLAFAVKIPLFPLHTWLPEAHAEAPTVGSILLAGILLKLGPYGLIRFSNFLFPLGFFFFRPLVFCLCLLSIYYTVLTALRQLDIKKLIAYSSIGHMALVLIGLAVNSIESFIGAVLLLIAHGFVSAGLFLLIGFIYDRYKTRIVLYYNGLMRINPKIGFFFFFFLLGNIAFPGTLNFISEIFIVIGLYQINWYITFLVVLSSIFILSYNLFIFARIFLYTENISYIYYTKDLTIREYMAVMILLFPIYFFGFFYKMLVAFFFKISLFVNFVTYYRM